MSYEERKAAHDERVEARQERLERGAAKAASQADQHHSASSSLLPSCGSPILQGHHSERRHRNAIERSNNHTRKAIEAGDRAKDLARRAASVGSGGISSGDPDAIKALQAKIDNAATLQANYKQTNKLVRKVVKKGHESRDKAAAELAKLMTAAGLIGRDPERSLESCRGLLFPDYGRAGVAPYLLTNNNANIKRMQKRIKALQAEEARPDGETYSGTSAGLEWEIVVDKIADRIRVTFSGRPDEDMCRKLKRDFGLKWSPSNGAWQRQITANARGALLRENDRYSLRGYLKANP